MQTIIFWNESKFLGETKLMNGSMIADRHQLARDLRIEKYTRYQLLTNGVIKFDSAVNKVRVKRTFLFIPYMVDIIKEEIKTYKYELHPMSSR